MKNEKALEIFNSIKQHAKDGNIHYYLKDKSTNRYMQNSDTGNSWRFFGFYTDDEKHLYGVYGDFLYRFGYGHNQIDNRSNTDEEIFNVIEKLLVDWDLEVEED